MSDFRKKEFLLAICSHRGTKSETAQSIELLHQAVGNIFLTRFYSGDAWIDRMRSVAATEFLKMEWADYMIFIDDDIVLLPEHIIQIYKDMKDEGYDLIGGGYPTRTGSQLASYGLGEYGGIQLDNKIHEIKWLATGFMGISRRLLLRMVDELKLPLLHEGQWCENYPFFIFCTHQTEKGNPMLFSEDWEFPLATETPVLMSDFSWKQLGDVNIGDKVVGFNNPLINGRHYEISNVTDKIEQKYPSYRIVTSEGEIVASPQHPLLVTSPCGKGTRWSAVKRLVPTQFLNIPVSSYPNPEINQDYMLGYIKGLWEGDGTIQPKYGYAVLEMTDKEAVDRAREYLNNLGLKTGDIKQRILNNPNWKPLWILRCFKGVSDICNKSVNSESMARGFLSGIYDAEGSFSQGRLRIATKSKQVSDEIKQSLNYIGILLEPYYRNDDMYEYIITTQETYHKFWQLVQPAIKRKISVVGQNGNGIMQYKKTEILNIEPTGKTQDLMCLTTSSHNFIANGFASHNCEKARQIGVKTYMDTRCVVGHLGDKVYTIEDVIAHNRQLDLKAQQADGVLNPWLADEALQKTVEVIKKYTNKFWIDSGTLLSALRDKDFNKFDHDIDVRLLRDDIPDALMPELVSDLYEIGYLTLQQNVGERRQLLALYQNEIMLDLKFCEQNEDWLWYYVWDKRPGSSILDESEVVVHVFPKTFYEKMGEIELHGKKYPTPYPIEDYLNYHYGDEWRSFKTKSEETYMTDFKWDAQHTPPCSKSIDQLDVLIKGNLQNERDAVKKDLTEFMGKEPDLDNIAERLWIDYSNSGLTLDQYYRTDNDLILLDLLDFNTNYRYLEWVKAELLNVKGKKILDFGCGLGTASFLLGQENEVTGYDVNQRAIDFCVSRRAKLGSKVTFTTKLPDEEFDMIVAIDVFEHIPDLKEALVELGKRLKKGGKLFHRSSFFQHIPVHIDHRPNFNSWLEEAGFKRVNELLAIKAPK